MHLQATASQTNFWCCKDRILAIVLIEQWQTPYKLGEQTWHVFHRKWKILHVLLQLENEREERGLLGKSILLYLAFLSEHRQGELLLTLNNEVWKAFVGTGVTEPFIAVCQFPFAGHVPVPLRLKTGDQLQNLKGLNEGQPLTRDCCCKKYFASWFILWAIICFSLGWWHEGKKKNKNQLKSCWKREAAFCPSGGVSCERSECMGSHTPGQPVLPRGCRQHLLSWVGKGVIPNWLRMAEASSTLDTHVVTDVNSARCYWRCWLLLLMVLPTSDPLRF